MTSVTGVSHISLTVRDLRSSEVWYRQLFGLQRVYDERGPKVDMVVLQDPDSKMIINLCQHHGAGTARFDETRTGLDHVTFGVASPDELDRWATRLSELAVEHSPVTETRFGRTLVFRDPDHIQLELFCRSGATSGIEQSEGEERPARTRA